MGKFDGFLFCTDCDGTLMDSQGKISPENAAAIRHFQQEGGLFTVATGRGAAHIRQFTDDFVPNAPLVICNGCFVVDHQTGEVMQKYLLDEKVHRVIDYAVDRFPSLQAIRIVYDQDGAFDMGYGDKPGFDQRYRIPDPWTKILFVAEPRATRRIQRRLTALFGDEYTFERSFRFCVECYRPESGKGGGVAVLRRLYGDRIHTVIGAGDSENDISLLNEADIGYAVANALPSVKAAAGRVTVSNDSSAIARILEELEAAL
ncbi:MAG: HAD-IIB family hydrolase [Clostridia bacterium]|nr:HAD-IIB family hydrolase [Clostridia bacterium]